MVGYVDFLQNTRSIETPTSDQKHKRKRTRVCFEDQAPDPQLSSTSQRARRITESQIVQTHNTEPAKTVQQNAAPSKLTKTIRQNAEHAKAVQQNAGPSITAQQNTTQSKPAKTVQQNAEPTKTVQQNTARSEPAKTVRQNTTQSKPTNTVQQSTERSKTVLQNAELTKTVRSEPTQTLEESRTQSKLTKTVHQLETDKAVQKSETQAVVKLAASGKREQSVQKNTFQPKFAERLGLWESSKTIQKNKPESNTKLAERNKPSRQTVFQQPVEQMKLKWSKQTSHENEIESTFVGGQTLWKERTQKVQKNETQSKFAGRQSWQGGSETESERDKPWQKKQSAFQKQRNQQAKWQGNKQIPTNQQETKKVPSESSATHFQFAESLNIWQTANKVAQKNATPKTTDKPWQRRQNELPEQQLGKESKQETEKNPIQSETVAKPWQTKTKQTTQNSVQSKPVNKALQRQQSKLLTRQSLWEMNNQTAEPEQEKQPKLPKLRQDLWEVSKLATEVEQGKLSKFSKQQNLLGVKTPAEPERSTTQSTHREQEVRQGTNQTTSTENDLPVKRQKLQREPQSVKKGTGRKTLLQIRWAADLQRKSAGTQDTELVSHDLISDITDSISSEMTLLSVIGLYFAT